MKSEDLKASAKNNTEKDFEFACFDSVDYALIEGLSQNQDFYTFLLNNKEERERIFGILAKNAYNQLREE